MEPAIHHGDRVCLHRGISKFKVDDLVAIRLDRGSPPLLKRVIAVTGDRVEIRGDRLIRNGSVVADLPSGHKRISALKVQLSHYDNIVPDGNLIALGDNEPQSFDSQGFGLVSLPQLLGIVDPAIEHCASPEHRNL